MIQGTTNEIGLLIGVEDAVDVKQYETKGQKNEESNKNNRFVRLCSLVACPVSSTPTCSPKRLLVYIGYVKHLISKQQE